MSKEKQAQPSVEQAEDLGEHRQIKAGCGILGRYPVVSVIAFAIVGCAIGVGLSYWQPEDDSKDKAIKWIGLVGDLFIRSLKCVVLPLVFVNVIISVVDMMKVGAAGSIGWKTIVMYTLTTLIASIIGIITVVVFKPLFKVGDFPPPEPAAVSLGCTESGSFVTEATDGSLVCSTDAPNASAQQFYIEDLTGTFVTVSGGVDGDITLSDTIYDGVFTKLLTDNIFEGFTTANFAAVVFFAIVFGCALSKVLVRIGGEEKSFTMSFLKELDGVLITIIGWIIMVSPFAVLSLIASAVGSQSDLATAFANVAYLVAAVVVGMLAHVLIVHIGVYYAVTRRNPLTWLKSMIPAQTMAFACASSAATIPVTLKCVRSTGIVPEPIIKFVVPLGATINMDGSAIYFPCACIWLAVLNGIDPNFGNYLLLAIISTIGSAGTAPVPSAGLVLVITAYNTVFNTTGVPEGFSFVVAIDWFLDRLQTMLNVTGDSVVCGMIAHLCPVDDPSAAKVMKAMEDSVYLIIHTSPSIKDERF